jgi:hypothetical protein
MLEAVPSRCVTPWIACWTYWLTKSRSSCAMQTMEVDDKGRRGAGPQEVAERSSLRRKLDERDVS